ncbi:glycosyltransferase [Kineococcus sp. SYSU DK004]|uniref:glycosyltransferase n=1 Tax=Kineococcus sp. SYSU DK004 TaxID=3383125 RepID=UPI003D7C4835
MDLLVAHSAHPHLAAALADGLTAAGAPARPLGLGGGPTPREGADHAGEVLRAVADHAGTGQEGRAGGAPVAAVVALDAAGAAGALAARSAGGPPVLLVGTLGLAAATGTRHAELTALLRAADLVAARTGAEAHQLAVAGARVHPAPLPVQALLAHRVRAVPSAVPPERPGPVVVVVGGPPRCAALRRAVLRLLADEPGARADVVGTRQDAAAAALHAAAVRHGVRERLRLLPEASPAQLAAVLDAAHVVVDPGGQDVTLVPLLAMSRSRAVLALDRPGADDVVVDAVTGVLVADGADQGAGGGDGGPGAPVAGTALADAAAGELLALVRDPFRCEALGVGGLDRLESRFRAEDVAAQLSAAARSVAPFAEPPAPQDRSTVSARWSDSGSRLDPAAPTRSAPPASTWSN